MTSKAPHRTRRRIRPTLIVVASALVLAGIAVGVSNPAEATVSTRYFHGECDESGVTAYAPDMNWFPNNSVTWYPTLYVWTDSGWAKVSDGPTQMATGADADGDPWSFGDTWMQTSYAFYPLSRGHYYAVSVSYTWAGPNVDTSMHTEEPVTHQLAQNNFDAISWKYSTDRACYVA